MTGAAGLSETETHAKHRTHSIVFKRQVAQEVLDANGLVG
jgi:hypothetical protein